MTQSNENIVASWRPSESDSDESGLPCSLHLTQIDGLPAGPSVLARLKASWFGRFYFRHLKPIPCIRALTPWLRRDLYPFYVNHIGRHFGSRINKRWRHLVRLDDYVIQHASPRTIVFEGGSVDTPVPDAYPTEYRDFLEPPHSGYSFPAVYVTEVEHAYIHGASNLVFSRESVLHHDLYDFERDFTSEELHGRHIIDPFKRRMRLLSRDDAPIHLAAAATFVDACASNYAHWMTEVLPRIAVFCSVERYSEVPLIIDDGLHPNILESLAVIVGPVRDVFALPRGRRVLVDKLHVTSVTGYVPFERRNPQLPGHSHGLFSPSAIQMVRDRCTSATIRNHTPNLPQKVFLRRTSGVRKVLNTVEIEKLLVAEGYVVVEPEKLGFLQQVELFRNATHIVGSSGAALANIVFVRPETNIVILISKFKGTSYWYWQNMACSTGASIQYVLGEPAESAAGIHADFNVDPEALNQALRSNS